MRLRDLRRQWQAISFEQKLAMFVAPFIVAIASGLVLAALTSRPPEGPTATPVTTTDPPSENLEVLALAAGDGDTRAETAPFLDLTLRNTGDTVSVLTSVDLTILKYAQIPICEAGGSLESSAEYDIELPVDPSAGDFIATNIRQQIAADEADRFRLALRLPESAIGDRYHLYHLAVAIRHDTADRPLTAGKAVVALPYVPPAHAFDAGSATGDVAECYRQNVATLKEFLALGGPRPPELNNGLLPAEPGPSVVGPSGPGGEASPDSTDAASSRPTAGEGLIAYNCGDDLCLIKEDGSGLDRITADPLTGDEAPDFAPDGSTIAFHRNSVLAEAAIHVIRLDGEEVARLTPEGSDDVQPRWSPDGSRILFVMREGGNWDIATMQADGSDRLRITTTPERELDPAWDASGRFIAFTRVKDDGPYVYLAGGDGSNEEEFGLGFSPAWSPDFTALAFTNPPGGIAIFEVTTGETTSVTHGQYDTEPAWSPDGARLAFRRGKVGPDSEIYLVDRDGSNLRQLTDDSEHSGFPDWAP